MTMNSRELSAPTFDAGRSSIENVFLNITYAQHTQAKSVNTLMGTLLKGTGYLTGVTAAYAVLRRGLTRAATADALYRLDGPMRQDLGIERDEIRKIAAKQALEAVPPARSLVGDIVNLLKAEAERRATIDRLSHMSTHLMDDIGVSRSDLEGSIGALVSRREAPIKTFVRNLREGIFLTPEEVAGKNAANDDHNKIAA